MNEDVDWRALYGPPSARFKDQELILRVLALYERADQYSRPVKSFLNHYLSDNRERSADDGQDLALLFGLATELVHKNVGPRAFRPVRSLNAAVLDSVMVGIMRRIYAGGEEGEGLSEAYEALIKNRAYLSATTSSTAAEDSVSERLRLATAAFAAD